MDRHLVLVAGKAVELVKVQKISKKNRNIKSRKTVVFSKDTTKNGKRGAVKGEKGRRPKNDCVRGIEKPRENSLGGKF